MIAVVGRTNVGKSTLLNTILEEKVSIVSSVAQTTRNMIRGILTEPRGQLVFLDTPGVHKASYDLGHIMNRIARASIEGVDVIMLVLDASVKPRQEDVGWLNRIAREDTPCVAVLNKIDKGMHHIKDYKEQWSKIAKEKNAPREPIWFEVSAKRNEGVKKLVDNLFEIVPEGPHLFPDDMLTDFPRKLNIADVIREKFNALLHDELPHQLAVEIEKIEEKKNGWHASGNIFVERNSQKGMVIGKKGHLLKQVKKEAEEDLAEIYGHPVSLELWVKVQEKWTRNYWMLKRLGYTQ